MIVFSGLCTPCSCLSHQYHFVNIEKSWTEAQSYCRQNYTDLATIDSTEEMNSLMEAVGSADVKEYAWIGLERGSSWKWQWSLADPGFYRQGETEFRNWNTGQPNNYGGRQNCVGMRDSGKWNDLPCEDSTDAGFFVCYHGGERSNQSYIRINESSKNWTEAQRYCREKHTDLVSVRNQTENEEVKRLLPASTWVWIGLYRDSWKWSDQKNSSFRNWSSGEPNNAGGQESCETQTPPPQRQAFSPVQVRRKLIEKGMPEDVRVMWKRQPNGDVFRVEKRKKP
ncbi:macrophage mannose receptor 1-like [Megalops cyprinoides]|uniref:macrophage mannose receptor 1-like n=1 Tax=Megalops cyprinoides TaxID=118141 RepID=UPI001864E294|nr:macrophage mannose receptor 1-like [Megalops cyprinoides]